MPYKPEVYLYFLICDGLWSALLATDYLFQDVTSTMIVQYCKEWDGYRVGLMAWLVDERISAIQNTQMMNTESENIFRLADEVGDTLIQDSVAEMQSIASSFFIEHNFLDMELLTYYLYCQWILGILENFEHILNKDITDVALREGYSENTQFQDLAHTLNEQLSGLYNLQIEERKVVDVYFDILKTTPPRMVANWKKAVYQAAPNAK